MKYELASSLGEYQLFVNEPVADVPVTPGSPKTSWSKIASFGRPFGPYKPLAESLPCKYSVSKGSVGLCVQVLSGK